jgi:hypothetical protein
MTDDYNSIFNSDYNRQIFEPATIRFLDLSGDVNLPADAPEGTPHVIDIGTIPEDEEAIERAHLRAPDMIVTVLYNINPKALQALLDLNIKDFIFV